MENSIIYMIVLQVALIALNAIFACAEIAIISMNDTKLAKMIAEGDKSAIRLGRLTNQPAKFLATIQIAITLSGFLGSAFAADNFSGVLVDAVLRLGIPIPQSVLDSISVVFITLVLSYFTLVFGELVPKQVGMRKAETLALTLSGLITGIAKVFSPLVALLTLSTNGVLRLLRIDPNEEEEQVSEEEIRMMIDVGSQKGTIDNEEKELIHNVFEFDDLLAEEIVTHRTDVIMLDLSDEMDEWKRTIYDSTHTYYPICEDSPDRIVGVLNAKEYFRLEDRSRESVMQHAVKPAYFVPETVKADTLFRNMKQSKNAIAIVMDEYGGMIGIITINDLVEQLVGDIGMEKEVSLLEKIEENRWKACGSVTIEALEEALNIAIPGDTYDTLNGLVFHMLEVIPEAGEEIQLQVGQLQICVGEIKKHQVEFAYVSVEQA